MGRFLPQEIIRIKRDGGVLTAEQIAAFVAGFSDGTISDAQTASFAMAVFLRGMDIDERVALTQAMAGSGRTMSWDRSALDGPILDKHSTGGVGDKVSLMLAPLVAACGGVVPMISGRGLGHTGGTLDKLESIPGYRATPTQDEFASVVAHVGCAVIGQTADLAPADRRLYAIRDVTATVESIPLITASILSKKLAADLDALVMDVKFGSGAFMTDPADALELASSIVGVARGAGLPTVALLTDMNQVLGRTAGNAVEIRETIDWLVMTGSDPRLDEVVYALGAEMLVLGELAPSLDAARAQLMAARADGSAAERFARMVAGLGGPSDLLERPDTHLPLAPVRQVVAADRTGVVERMDVRRIGLAVVSLGGGRTRVEDPVDPSVGFTDVVGPGDRIESGDALAVVHARTIDAANLAADELRSAIVIGARSAGRPSVVVADRIVG
jgi:thymidine phosphorylase